MSVQTVLSAIANLGAARRAIPLLLDALNDPHHLVREQAVRELDQLDYKPALPRIEPLLRDSHTDVRRQL
ncbi:MAG: hypothetical protein DLM61_22395 [Pseudonocardiales bacterium]|nr:MAG: hypothetical protein DLM61_22395 [Pseudonocardiales bacterium]